MCHGADIRMKFGQVRFAALIVAALSLFLVTSPFAHAMDMPGLDRDPPAASALELQHHTDESRDVAGSAEFHCGAHVLATAENGLDHIVPDGERRGPEGATICIPFNVSHEPPPPRT